jgi:hypothetical protein
VRVDDPSDAQLSQLSVEPWAGDVRRDAIIRIEISEISGRHIRQLG